jgi:hypothetical protein
MALAFLFPPAEKFRQHIGRLGVRSFVVLCVAAAACAFAAAAYAGPEGGMVQTGTRAPDTSTFSGIPGKRIGPIAGMQGGYKEAPLPAPHRPIGWGFNCHEFYGPTYYYPWYHNTYESLHPTYYPFYHPRLWPNYKTDAMYCTGKHCGASRSLWYWDSYDDWMRGRYEEHQ